jgi:integrase
MAFDLMWEGVPVPLIQAQLGHASLATTQRYLDHLAPKDLIDTMQRREFKV